MLCVLFRGRSFRFLRSRMLQVSPTYHCSTEDFGKQPGPLHCSTGMLGVFHYLIQTSFMASSRDERCDVSRAKPIIYIYDGRIRRARIKHSEESSKSSERRSIANARRNRNHWDS